MSGFDQIETTSVYDFIFTIARMNPPTPGHKELVKQMMTTASKYRIPVYIGLSSTCCKEDNPLTCDEKKALVETMIAQIRKENSELQMVTATVICSDDVGSAIMFNLTSKIITDYDENTNKANGLMFFGDDYVGCENSQGITECLIEDPKINYSRLKSQFEHLYFAPPLVRKSNSTETLILLDRTIIPLPHAGMSATFIRNLTLADEGEFNKKISKHYDDNSILNDLRKNQTEIFNTIMSKAVSDIDTRIISNGKTLFDLIQYRYKLAPSKKEAPSKKAQPSAKKDAAIKAAISLIESTKSQKKGVGGKKPRITKRHLKTTTKRKTRVHSRK